MRSDCKAKTSVYLLAYGLSAALCAPCAQPETAAHTGQDLFRWDVSGEARARYETLNGQFRAQLPANDQGLFFRSLLHLRAVSEHWTAGLEIQDSRSYLTDSGTPISSSYVNAVDILQAYLKIPADGVFGDKWTGNLKLGRQTLSIGSKRQIERVSYANVIKNYTGAYLTLHSERQDEVHVFIAAPLQRRPADTESLLDNRLQLDEEAFNRTLAAVHVRRPDALPRLLPGTWGELFAYGLYERDAYGNQSPNRRYLTPGFRLYRPRAPNRLDFDIEGALRFGTRRASSAPNDTRDLDVFASMLLVRVGYTFDHRWSPNLALQYYWASGDEDPFDNNFDQYERLFGGRRTDLNNTSLHGPLTPANLSAPGLRLEMAPTAETTLRLTYSAASLASSTDAFLKGRQRDPQGQSGDFLGHAFDSRFTYELAEDRLELEWGASLFLHREFTRNNPQAPESSETIFGYMQVTYSF
ncbi:MAG: alginate export family protein [Chromatocurvus sp.]